MALGVVDGIPEEQNKNNEAADSGEDAAKLGLGETGSRIIRGCCHGL